MKKATILLTGGAGYIGSHTALALAKAGYEPVLLDNFSNSQPEVLDRLGEIAGRSFVCERMDVLDTARVQRVIARHGIDAVVHLAGHKAVGESVANPMKYYRNNVGGMTSLLEALEPSPCRAVVFSSSATVYGDPAYCPITEDFPRQPANPYGHTKAVCEDMLAAARASHPSWRTAVLRYFNPVGALPSGLIGEDPKGVPNNLMPFIAQVATGLRSQLCVYGADYSTPDGTGVRVYLHVQDLAAGHVAAVRALLNHQGSFTVNLGTGVGYSVLDVVRAFERASGRAIPYRLTARRPGDVAIYLADPSRAAALLQWRATRALDEMCADAWRWQQRTAALETSAA